MSIRYQTALAIALGLPMLVGCSLEAAVVSCAQCGEVRAIVPRPAGHEIRLLTDAPRPINAAASNTPLVYDVRVRMDRGGSRDFVLANRERLRVGDRVEVRDGQLVPVSRTAGLGLT